MHSVRPRNTIFLLSGFSLIRDFGDLSHLNLHLWNQIVQAPRLNLSLEGVEMEKVPVNHLSLFPMSQVGLPAMGSLVFPQEVHPVHFLRFDRPESLLFFSVKALKMLIFCFRMKPVHNS